MEQANHLIKGNLITLKTCSGLFLELKKIITYPIQQICVVYKNKEKIEKLSLFIVIMIENAVLFLLLYSLITNICYKLMENPSISRATAKESRDIIAHIIGTSVKRYNHGIGDFVFQLFEYMYI